MKKVYESPVMMMEEFSAEQSVAGNCKPGVKESEAKEVEARCDSGHGLAWCREKTLMIFTEACTNQVTPDNMVGTDIVVTSKQYDLGQISSTHHYVYNNSSNNKPYYWNS